MVTAIPTPGVTSGYGAQLNAYLGEMRPGSSDKVVFVSARGSDSNDGWTLQTALATIPAAINALGGPGVIQLAQGSITTSTAISLTSTNGITIRGVAGQTAGATPATSLTFSGTGAGSFIDARSSTGFVLENVRVLYSSSSFTGILIDLRDSGSGNTAFATIRDCYLGGASGITTADSLVNIANTHSLRFERVQFRGANYGLRAKGVSTDTANAITLSECYFNGNATAHILNPGDGWVISGCTWEPLTGGVAGAIACQVGTAFHGMAILGGWAGDVTSGAGGTQFTLIGNNISIIGTLIGGNTGSTGVKFLTIAGAAPTGLTVAARFDGCTTGIDLANGTTVPIGVDFSRALFNNVTTPIFGATGYNSLATTARTGFTYLPTTSGTPTGSPFIVTGHAPALIDSAASKLWVNFAGTWKSVTLT